MINLVHDVAGSYRELVQANSYPGQLGSLKKYIENNDLEVPFYEATLLFVYMLLDSEVTFSIVGDTANEVAEYVAKLTYAKKTSIQEADFIFVLSTASKDEKRNALRNASEGTLVDPHKSATVICEAESVKDGEKFLAEGPGIEDENEINISFSEGWEKIREDKNREYPLGIEMYFVDKNSRILALPRTTILKREEH